LDALESWRTAEDLLLSTHARTSETGSRLPESRPDLVIEGGIALTMVHEAAPLENARIIVRGDRILEIQSGPKKGDLPPHAEILDAREGIIMPGLVNAHTHAAMTLFRGFADDLPLSTWLHQKIFPAEAKHLNEETVYWGALLACLEMIASGTTTFSDGYFFQDATIRAAHQAGLRAVVAQGVIDFPAPGVPDPKENLSNGRRFLERWIHFSDLITPGLFCHSPVTCSDDTLVQAMESSRSFSVPLQTHLSETAEEVAAVVRKTGVRPVRHLDRLGLLCEGLICAHAIHLDDEEITLLAKRGVKIVHVPESNMKLSSGVARVPDMVAKGLTIALGTDGCGSNNDLDLFKEMDSAAKLSKVFEMNPVSLDAFTVLKMATISGAKALGLEKDIGTLEPGKKADIIVVDIGSPHLVPLYNPFSSLVYSAMGSDVKHVMVNGRILYKDRRCLTLDALEIMSKVRKLCRGMTV
jgi:5-methylthioadenosine/S-adenosylhomocysteine deaminase